MYKFYIDSDSLTHIVYKGNDMIIEPDSIGKAFLPENIVIFNDVKYPEQLIDLLQKRLLTETDFPKINVDGTWYQTFKVLVS